MSWLRQHGRKMAVMTMTAAVVLVLGTGRAWAPAVVDPPSTTVAVQLTLGDLAPTFVQGFELNAEAREQHTLRVNVGFTSHSILAAVRLGQQYDVALIDVFDATLAKLVTYRVNPAQVTALRIATDPTSGQVLQELVLTFKTLTIIPPAP